ncbi:hypothetical protein B0H65DRAFT_508273 [Neurospora tetraspora]|uniref:Uncharacterized protein n=1 Tax=Neurospora tetraspora TaxID=94610 RepID=A0AAE0JIE7_9PEZI|nr:hypothetical protein B0H65DRAFT_508273 [Neurospora tetraspora]
MPHKQQHRHIRQRYLSIINILVTITAILFASPVHAIPTFTVAADIPPNAHAAPTPTQIPPSPTPTTTATTYTVTKISSTTLTTVSPVLHISPHILSLITTMTVTTYEPWPAFPSLGNDLGLTWSSPWSTTVLEEVVSSVTWVERRRYLEGRGTGLKGEGDMEEDGEEEGKEEETTVTSFVVTTENTWVVHPAGGPTGIFLATGVGVVVGCGGCSLAPAQPTTGSGSRLGRAAETEEPAARRWEQSTAQEQENVTRDKPKKGQLGADMTWTTEAEATVVVVEEDPICKSTNLTTGCQGQCIWKPAFRFTTTHQAINSTFPDTSSSSPSTTRPEAHPATAATGLGTGTYWCLHIHPYHYADPSMRMGRACWGSYLRYRQLNAPCLVGDVGMACLPCVKGGEGEPGKKDESWDAVFWEGEE